MWCIVLVSLWTGIGEGISSENEKVILKVKHCRFATTSLQMHCFLFLSPVPWTSRWWKDTYLKYRLEKAVYSALHARAEMIKIKRHLRHLTWAVIRQRSKRKELDVKVSLLFGGNSSSACYAGNAVFLHFFIPLVFLQRPKGGRSPVEHKGSRLGFLFLRPRFGALRPGFESEARIWVSEARIL